MSVFDGQDTRQCYQPAQLPGHTMCNSTLCNST